MGEYVRAPGRRAHKILTPTRVPMRYRTLCNRNVMSEHTYDELQPGWKLCMQCKKA